MIKPRPYDRWQTVFLPIVLAAIVAIPGIIAAWKATVVEQKVEEIHDLANSRLSELLEVSKSSSRAEGVLEGKASRDKGKEK